MVKGTGLAERSRPSVIVGLALAAIALLGAGLACDAATSSATTATASTTTLASASTTLSPTVVSQTTTSVALVPTTTTASTQATVAPVDRHDPESVLRGYFSAWQSGDWEEEDSFMAEQYANMQHEPVASLRIVELRLLEGSASHCLYDVVFDITVKGQGASMTTGRYDWTYDLNWDGQRQSWIITNYGEG